MNVDIPSPAAETFRIIPHLNVKPSRLATAKRYTRLEDAFADMGEGIIVGSDNRIVAFHEKHLRFIEATPKLVTSATDASM